MLPTSTRDIADVRAPVPAPPRDRIRRTTPVTAENPEPPTSVIEASRGLVKLDLGAIWQRRELLYFLVWRDVKVRYKQTAIGAAWAVLSPLLTVLIFSVVFGRLARMPSDGLPYIVFAFAGFLPWTYFAQAFGRGSVSLVGNAHLITKVYFPRLVIPLSAVTTPLVDFALSLATVVGLMLWFRITPTWALLALPAFLVMAIVLALGVSLWLAPVNVRYRDVSHTIPFLVQVWMYCSPVVYPLSLIPESWRFVYSLNPMVGVIEGFRWSMLGTAAPNTAAIAIGAIVTLGMLVGGLVFFRRMERAFADVI
jgi:lipopolysaccharide transport system permease protein